MPEKKETVKAAERSSSAALALEALRDLRSHPGRPTLHGSGKTSEAAVLDALKKIVAAEAT